MANFKNSGQELFSSFFCLYEFKTGFIKTLIEYYFFIQTHNEFPQSIADWSDNFSSRSLKFTTILNSIFRILNCQNNSKSEYLASIEFSIKYCLIIFDVNLTRLVGNFESNEIVKFKISSVKDYGPFIELCKKNQCMMPQEKFWEENEAHLNKLIERKEDFSMFKLEKMFQKLSNIKSNKKNSNKVRVNRGVGDAIICIDCPKNYYLASIDNSFRLLSEILEKKLYFFKKDKNHNFILPAPRSYIATAEKIVTLL